MSELEERNCWVHLDYMGRVLWCPGWVKMALSYRENGADTTAAAHLAGVSLDEQRPRPLDGASGPTGGRGRWVKCTRREALDVLSLAFMQVRGD